jgi:hypothetical protein
MIEWLAMGILAWLALGWLGGYRVRRRFVGAHLGWDGSDERLALRLLCAGPVGLLGTLLFLTRIWGESGCDNLTHGFCAEYMAGMSLPKSLFGNTWPKDLPPVHTRQGN